MFLPYYHVRAAENVHCLVLDGIVCVSNRSVEELYWRRSVVRQNEAMEAGSRPLLSMGLNVAVLLATKEGEIGMGGRTSAKPIIEGLCVILVHCRGAGTGSNDCRCSVFNVNI